jgi:hypothetical protein
MHQKFSYPTVDQRLSRLHIYDGLMMNAKRWLAAHNYHHQRQNIHYQAINQPGIVYGLGIKKLETLPEGVPEKYRDQRWLEIQPGLAIDLAGNPIIVDEPIAFRVETEAPETGVKIVHLVLSYVEPKYLDRQHSVETSHEQYRLDEKVSFITSGAYEDTSPLTERDIELCRFRLAAGSDVTVKSPTDVLCPGLNEIDLRDRIQAQTRPLAVVRIAQVQPQEMEQDNERCQHNLRFLMRSIAALYPFLQGHNQIDAITLKSHPENAGIANYDLIYLPGKAIETVLADQWEALKTYLQRGTTVLIELDALDEATSDELLRMIMAELAVQLAPVGACASPLEMPHECCTTPFLFDTLPTIEQQMTQLWIGGGVIVMHGKLFPAWGLNTLVPLSRQEIRAAHELGINFLHFAWKRRLFTQLLQ